MVSYAKKLPSQLELLVKLLLQTQVYSAMNIVNSLNEIMHRLKFRRQFNKSSVFLIVSKISSYNNLGSISLSIIIPVIVFSGKMSVRR